MEMNDRVILQRRVPEGGYGGGYEVQAEAAVWGHLEEVSASFRSRLGAAGISVDKTLHMWRAEFGSLSPTHVVLNDGSDYRIDSVGTSLNELLVKLVLVNSG